MELERRRFQAEGIQFTGGKTRLENRKLLVNAQEIANFTSDCIEKVDYQLVYPGDHVRVIKVLDIVTPMAATEKEVFPGFIGTPATVGWGSTNILEGVRVISCGAFPQPQKTSLTTKDGFIDMFGPASSMCMGSDSFNLVLQFQPKPHISNDEFDEGARLTTLRVARFLGQITLSVQPDEIRRFCLEGTNDDLPNVIYIDQLQDQGPLIRAYLYGRPLGEDFVPTFIHPNELMDGAVVSGNYRNCMKKPTSFHVQDPVVERLYVMHGRTLNFRGVIISRGHHADADLKLRSAAYAAKLAKILGAEGMIIAMEGGGNGTIDYMLTVQCCEECGIKTVGVIHEMGGGYGEDKILVFSSPRADALVSAGNPGQIFTAPSVETVLGGQSFINYSGIAHDPYREFPARAADLYGSFWQMALAGYKAIEA